MSAEYRLVKLDRVSSTMEVAWQLVDAGAASWTVVRAEEQTSGRGRLGRRWISPRGGLWFSIIIRGFDVPDEPQLASIAACVAVAKALEELYGVKPLLKWPNDVMVGGKKIAGVLVEARARGRVLEALVIGVGVNANVDSRALKDQGLGATSLLEILGRPVDLDELLAEIVVGLKRLLRSSRRAIVEEYRARLGTLGKPVRVVLATGEVEGVAVDLLDDGSLVVESEGRRLVVRTGDVYMLREKEG